MFRQCWCSQATSRCLPNDLIASYNLASCVVVAKTADLRRVWRPLGNTTEPNACNDYFREASWAGLLLLHIFMGSVCLLISANNQRHVFAVTSASYLLLWHRSNSEMDGRGQNVMLCDVLGLYTVLGLLTSRLVRYNYRFENFYSPYNGSIIQKKQIINKIKQIK